MKAAGLVLAGVLALATSGCADLTTTGVPEDGPEQTAPVSPGEESHASPSTPGAKPDGEATDPALAEAQEVADTLVGMQSADAQTAVEKAGLTYRVVAEDGQAKPATSDYRPDRINVEIEEGQVTKASVG